MTTTVFLRSAHGTTSATCLLKSLREGTGRRDFSYEQFTRRSKSQGLVPKIQASFNSWEWLKVGTRGGYRCPATSPCNKTRGQVPSSELVVFVSKSSRRDKRLVLATSPTKTNWFEFLGQTLATCSRLKTLRMNCSLDKSPRPVLSCKLFRGQVAPQGLVAETMSYYADLKIDRYSYALLVTHSVMDSSVRFLTHWQPLPCVFEASVKRI